jgi:hypothetical protein
MVVRLAALCTIHEMGRERHQILFQMSFTAKYAYKILRRDNLPNAANE